MDDHRPARRNVLTRVAALGVACASLAAAGCSGGGGTTALPHGSGGGVPPGSPSPSASPTPRASATPTPVSTATPTPVATATPTPAATSTPVSGGPGFACSAAPANMNQPYYADVFVAGDVPANGGAFSLNATISSWTKAEYVPAVPTPTPVPTSTPTTIPTAPPPPPTRPMYIYSGTYHIDSASAPTDGCFTLITTTDGTSLKGYPISAEGIGFVNPPQTPFTTQILGSGKVSAIALTVSPAALPASGTISLDDGDGGTISVQSVQTVQLPLNRVKNVGG